MSNPRKVDQNEPWYRNPWVWLLIAIPSLTVAGCMFTIYLAITHPHSLVGEANSTTSVVTGSTDTGRE